MSIVKQYILGLTIVLFLLCSGTYAAEYSDGQLGKALILDGSSHTVKIPHYAALKPAKAITISAWIKPERVGKGGWEWQEIYRKEDGNARALMAIGEREKKHSLCFGLGIDGKFVEHGAPLAPSKLLDGKWHLVCVTFDGKAMKFYADGEEIGATTKASGAIDTGGEAPAYIGSYKGTGEFFKGGIDDVRLYNRALSAGEIKTMAVAHLAQTAKPFTLAVLPDTQFYCDTRLKLSAKWGNGDLRRYFFAQTKWVRDNQKRLNIAFLVHEGDIVQADAPEEWAIAKKAMSILDGKVPYCMCLGNHDMGFEKADNKYGGNIGVNRTTHFNTYFPRDKFAKRREFGGTFKPDRHDNSWYHFEAAGMSFLIVALECKPRDEVLDWANKIVSKHPGHRVIVLTHAYMTASKSRNTGGMSAKGNTGEQTWQKFVKKHKNIFMVLCGHHTGEAVRTDTGDHGNKVHQILSDYQHLNNGGESWLRYMVFKPGANKISIYTYNPALDKFKNGPSSRFDLDYPMALPLVTLPGITRPGASNDVNREAVDGIVGWWKLDGDLKNSAAKAAAGSVAQFRGVDRKWKATPLSLGGSRLDIRAAGEAAVRVTIRPIDSKQAFPYTPALIQREYPKPVITSRKLASNFKPLKAQVGPLTVEVTAKPLTVLVTTSDNKPVQKITFAPDGKMSFVLDGHPVLGLGEGGPKQSGKWQDDKVEFDRRGRAHVLQPRYDTMAYGSRSPVALLAGTGGWGLFVAAPWGDIDLTSKETGTFTPAVPIEPGTVVSRRQQRRGRIGLPPPGWKTDVYDVFVFDAHEPVKFMKDVSTISGPAVLPPRWALGYMQSHRTLEDDEQIVSILDTFRKKQIPVDAVIYLGTGFTPRGWNTSQPSFKFNRGVFKREPKDVLSDLHARHAKVVMHMIPWDRGRLETLHGSIPPKSGETVDSDHIASYWKEHNALVDTGVDAWWPDEGDWFSFHERMKRHQLYYEGPLSKTPNVRPWSLHRNGHLGVARYGGWIWSGDTHASFKTLEAQIAVGINHSLSLSPFWGSDIGGFYPTQDLTGELYARWFQFAAFTSSFRGHGRTWQMRLPWGWGLDKMGPKESNTPPLESELNNPRIEPIAKKYAELRYQLLSYNYTLAWEARTTGMPMMRSMWLHHPSDNKARSIGDQYLWGRDLLIAPVYKKGATTRDVYLPAGKWYDWWTGKAETGGRTVQRAVDLATMPIYVRAGAIVPVDPIRQYTGQKVDEPTTLKIYRGANGKYTLYDDDGISLNYLQGDSVQTLIKWDDAAKKLSLEPESKQTATRTFQVELIPDGVSKEIQYTGQRVDLKL